MTPQDAPSPIPTGKLPPDLLASLLTQYAGDDPRLTVGPRLGMDAAAIDFGDRTLIVATDPITFASDEIGWYSVHVNANDVAMMGTDPRWFLATLLLPEGRTTPAQVETIFRQMAEACESLGAVMAGGHTEVTYNLDRPIVSGIMLGEVAQGELIRGDGARAGDDILLVRGIPIEGTAILAREKGKDLQAMGLAPEIIERAGRYLHDPGISVVSAARLCRQTVQVHAMHDPTEGGLATGLLEMAQAADLGLEVDLDAVMILPEGAALCQALGLDPLGTIASGALLVALSPWETAKVLDALHQAAIPAAHIGTMCPPEHGLWAQRDGERIPLPRFPVDEIARFF